MNDKILKIILENKDRFTKYIFTSKQMDIIRKYAAKEQLDKNERYQLYTSIKKKIEALETTSKEGEYYIYGQENILEEKLKTAKEILKPYPKAFIAGSFLFKREYKDIDLFIIKERGYKETHEDKLHMIELTEKKLNTPVIAAAARIAVSNFPINTKPQKKPLKISEIMSIYHEATIEIMEKKEREQTRTLVFQYNWQTKNILLDGKSLKETAAALKTEELERFTKELILHSFKKSYIYVSLHNYIKVLEKAIRSEDSTDNLTRYKILYEDIINETRRSKAETA
ncbi:MAG: hypothetical protein V1837_04765 [Candidatus Woesearchaeota archaeon]